MASVGTGMSAFAKSDEAGFAICYHGARSSNGGQQHRKSSSECPFCLIASQNNGQFALAGEALASPVYAAGLASRIVGSVGTHAFIPLFDRTTGVPRAPPVFSV